MKKIIAFLLFIVMLTYSYASLVYYVKKGDTLFSIAKKYHLKVDTLKQLNNLSDNHIKVKQKLYIRKLHSTKTQKKKVVYHKVKKGETLWRIAYKYHLPFQKIMIWNKIKHVGDLKTGQVLTIYLDKKDTYKPKKTSKRIRYKGKLKLPVKGIVETAPLHKGINIKCRNGAKVRSSGKGTVEYVGQLIGYKNVVIVQHPGSLFTIYGGLGRIIVRKGQKIRSGRTLGYISKMSHYKYPILHFEVIHYGKNVNPIKYLKRH